MKVLAAMSPHPKPHPPKTGPVLAQAVTCFTPDTLITTTTGRRVVQNLRPGDRALTRDNGFQPVVWTGQRVCRHLNDGPGKTTAPVLIRANALAPGLPTHDMIVSPGHRFLTTDPARLPNTGETEALIEARALVGTPGIEQMACNSVTYIHVLFERHEVILSENTWSESFQLTEANARAIRHNRAIQASPHFATADHIGMSFQDPARTCLPNTASAA